MMENYNFENELKGLKNLEYLDTDIKKMYAKDLRNIEKILEDIVKDKKELPPEARQKFFEALVENLTTAALKIADKTAQAQALASISALNRSAAGCMAPDAKNIGDTVKSLCSVLKDICDYIDPPEDPHFEADQPRVPGDMVRIGGIVEAAPGLNNPLINAVLDDPMAQNILAMNNPNLLLVPMVAIRRFIGNLFQSGANLNNIDNTDMNRAHDRNHDRKTFG